MKGGVYIKFLSAIVTLGLGFSLFFIPTEQANAQAGCAASAVTAYLGKSAISKVLGSVVPVGDSQVQISSGGQFIAKCILTPIAIQMARTMARNISNSIVNWINNDFHGKPSFVTNTNGFLKDSADEVIGDFIYGSDLQFLCQPFSAQLKLVLATKYTQPFQQQIRCSLSDVSKNVNNFAKNNGGVGWNNWLELTTAPQNNVYGAYLMADSQLTQNIQAKVNAKQNELKAGQGFLNFESCKTYETDAEVQARIAANGNSQVPGFKLASSGQSTKQCKVWNTSTPGYVVSQMASKVTGQWSDQLSLATDIDQIVGALISHFADKMISGKGGFLGLSSSGGYATQNMDYNTASTLAADTSNSDNSGLSDANAAANAGIANILPSSVISSGDNVAQGASVTMSKPGVGSSAWVTDGDITTSAGTADEQNPWIQIDLGSASDISELHVWYPAQKPASFTLGTIDAVVSKDSGTRDWVSPQTVVTDSSSNPVVIKVNGNGRYIKIERSANGFECGDPTTGSQTCYYPLEIAELDVVTSGNTASPVAGATSGENGPAITVGPADGPSTIGHEAPSTFSVPIKSSDSATIPLIDVTLYAGNTPISFNKVFIDGRVGKKQASITNFYSPADAPGIQFSNVPVGPNSDVTISVTGVALPPSANSAFKIVVTAKDDSGNSIGSATSNFVVQ